MNSKIIVRNLKLIPGIEQKYLTKKSLLEDWYGKNVFSIHK